MTSKRTWAAVAVAAVVFGPIASALPTMARTRHHHPRPAPAVAAPGPYAQVRDPAEFYPEQIEGGVRGNLSFNNQLRKHSDPLNANGGGG